jgi:hypothetical protein
MNGQDENSNAKSNHLFHKEELFAEKSMTNINQNSNEENLFGETGLKRKTRGINHKYDEENNF